MSESIQPPIEDFLRCFVMQSPEHAVLLLNTEQQVVWANPGAGKLFGQSAKELVGLDFKEIFTEEDVRLGVPQHEVDSARSCSSADDDRWQTRADGSRFWASGSLVALHGDDGRPVGYCKIIRNRTDGKEHLDYLRNKVQTLTRVNERKDLFLATVSHELRNPLSPLITAAELLQDYAEEHPELKQPVGVIRRQVDAMERLISDLVDVARIGAGKIHFEAEPLDLRAALNQAVETLRPKATAKRQQTEILLLQEPVIIKGDPARLQQVFINLIDNAIKYTPEAGRIWIKLSREGPEAIVRIEDNGVGIEPQILSQIFDMFTQADGPHAAKGLGIGLALVKNLVTLHGGTVQAQSDGPGHGTEVIVRLPMAADEE